MTHCDEAALNVMRDNAHLAGRAVGGGDDNCTWYYPPTVLDENGRLWGRNEDHLSRVLENRTAVRHYYRSLLPDAPAAPGMLSRAGHVAAVEWFAGNLLSFYRPLVQARDQPHRACTADLMTQTAALLSEANVLFNVALAMRQ